MMRRQKERLKKRSPNRRCNADRAFVFMVAPIGLLPIPYQKKVRFAVRLRPRESIR